jgi:hypothetical protein
MVWIGHFRNNIYDEDEESNSRSNDDNDDQDDADASGDETEGAPSTATLAEGMSLFLASYVHWCSLLTLVAVRKPKRKLNHHPLFQHAYFRIERPLPKKIAPLVETEVGSSSSGLQKHRNKRADTRRGKGTQCSVLCLYCL